MKRALDVAGAAIGLVVLSPLFAAVFVLVRRNLGAPAIFSQKRPGLRGEVFTILKFRTMTGECSAQGELLTDAERLTPFGRQLRATSLDELPELWNVLKGDMSLVGPRPLLVRYLKRYSPEQARRHEVRPGLTGWAQIHGRNEQSWEERLRMDVWYVDHRSLWLDLKILAATVRLVIRREGVAEHGEATRAEFRGL